MILTYCNIDGKRHRVRAKITTEHPSSHYGQPVIVLDDGDALDLQSWILCNYQIVKASKNELQQLEKIKKDWDYYG